MFFPVSSVQKLERSSYARQDSHGSLDRTGRWPEFILDPSFLKSFSFFLLFSAPDEAELFVLTSEDFRRTGRNLPAVSKMKLLLK